MLLAYEEERVLAVLAEGGASVESMCEADPGRWNRGYLKKTLRRLHDQGRIQRLARRHSGRTVYITTKGRKNAGPRPGR